MIPISGNTKLLNNQKSTSSFFLILKNVSKRYGGVTALEDVDFDINKGEVHCLVGENGSGKSTLVKIITGVVEPEPGAEIIIENKPVNFLTSFEAFQKGIHVVHQDLSLFPNLSVAENISSHSYIEKGSVFVKWEDIENEALEVMNRLSVELDPSLEVGKLSVADQQLVAICRAIASEAKLIILDEPTSSLTWKEVNRLFNFIDDLKARGIATLFISHRLDEVLEVGERITVLRNGKKVGTFIRKDLDKYKLITLMVGKKLSVTGPQTRVERAKVVLKVQNLSKRGQYHNVSFSLHKGEVLGIIGPRGAGRTELALSLFGLNPPDTGQIYIEGKQVLIKSNRDAIKLGIGYLPENRLVQGLVLEQSVENNVVITNLDKVIDNVGLVDNKRKGELAKNAVETFNIKVSGIGTPVRTLSGGNQQRVVLAKWILTAPKILILDSPTNGIDVAAKESIHELIASLSKKGVSIILISDEETEIMQNCPRALVMKEGQIVGEYSTSKISEEDLRKKIREAGKDEEDSPKAIS